MESIPPAEVERVAELARIELTEEEKARTAKQLADILQAFARLQALDLHDVEPMAHAVPMRNVWRADQSRPSWPQAEILANAPEADDGCFRVPSVMGESS